MTIHIESEKFSFTTLCGKYYSKLHIIFQHELFNLNKIKGRNYDDAPWCKTCKKIYNSKQTNKSKILK
jgi:hypothetical protein